MGGGVPSPPSVFYIRNIIAWIAEKVNNCYDRKKSEYTVHHSLLRMWLHTTQCPCWPLLTTETPTMGKWSTGRRWPGLRNQGPWGLPGAHVAYLWKTSAGRTIWERLASGGSVMFCWESVIFMWMLLYIVSPILTMLHTEHTSLQQQYNSGRITVQEWIEEHSKRRIWIDQASVRSAERTSLIRWRNHLTKYRI